MTLRIYCSNKPVNFRFQIFSNFGIANKKLWASSDLGNQGNHDKQKINGNVANHGNVGNYDRLTIGTIETLLTLEINGNHDNETKIIINLRTSSCKLPVIFVRFYQT
jgi:hypothetical protein